MYYTILLVFITVIASTPQNRRNRYRLCNNYSTAAILLILSKPMLHTMLLFLPLPGSLLSLLPLPSLHYGAGSSPWLELLVAFWVNTKRGVAMQLA